MQFRNINGRKLIYFRLNSTGVLQCHRVNVRRSCSYIDSTDWIKKKKATINPKNKNDKSV